MGTKAGVLLGFIVMMALMGFVVMTSGDDAPLAPDPGNQPLVALGRMVYAGHCARCHGARGEDWQARPPDGTLPAPPHDAGGQTWQHPDSWLLAITRDGSAGPTPPGKDESPSGTKSAMPGFAGTLNEREIVAAVAFIKSLWPADIRARQARITAQAKRAL